MPPTVTDDGGQDAAPRAGAGRSHRAGPEGGQGEHDKARRRERRGDDGAGNGLEKLKGLGQGTGRLIHVRTPSLFAPFPERFQPRRGLLVTEQSCRGLRPQNRLDHAGRGRIPHPSRSSLGTPVVPGLFVCLGLGS